MSETQAVSLGTDSRQLELWSNFSDKSYRESFAESHVAAYLAGQVTGLREARGWTQKTLADRAGMAQPRVSILEDPSYDRASLSTLRRLANAFDVALVVKFVSFSELLTQSLCSSEATMVPASFADDAISSDAASTYGGMGDAAPTYGSMSEADATVLGSRPNVYISYHYGDQTILALMHHSADNLARVGLLTAPEAQQSVALRVQEPETNIRQRSSGRLTGAFGAEQCAS